MCVCVVCVCVCVCGGGGGLGLVNNVFFFFFCPQPFFYSLQMGSKSILQWKYIISRREDKVFRGQGIQSLIPIETY